MTATGKVWFYGTRVSGETLNASNSLADAKGIVDLKYQWYANGQAIPGAVGQALTLTDAEVGKTVTVSATYKNASGAINTVSSTPNLLTSYQHQQSGNWVSSAAFRDGGQPYIKDNPVLVMQSAQIDFNQDGLLDYITYDSYPLDIPTPNPPPSLFINDGRYLNKVAWPGPSLGNPHGVKILVGDFDGNGTQDLFSLVAVDPPFGRFPDLQDYNHLIFTGNRIRAVEFTSYRGFWYAGASGDIDGDGDLDIVAFNFHVGANGVQNILMRNDGAGNFSFSSDGIGNLQVDQAELHDLNRDGHLDLAVDTLGQEGRVLRILWGNGQRFGLENSASINLPSAYFVSDLLFADLNGDGFEEILTAGSDDKGNYLVRAFTSRDKGAQYTENTDSVIVGNSIKDRFDHLRLYDIDGNGRLDLFSPDMSSNIRWEWNGAAFVRVSQALTSELIYLDYVAQRIQAAPPPADTRAPTITSIQPSANAANVSVATNIVLTYSEAIARGTGVIELQVSSTTGLTVESFDAATSPRLSISGTQLTIDPSQVLNSATTYLLKIPVGSIRDLAGNGAPEFLTYRFTTAQAGGVLMGSPIADSLLGSDGADSIYGLAGDDSLLGSAGADWLSGESGRDRLDGGTGDDIIMGGSDADTLNGDGGNDIIYGDAGDDDLNGGDGRDEARYSGKRADHQVTRLSDGVLVVNGIDGRDTLTGIERVIFQDIGLAFDADGVGGKTYRLYKAAYDRTPDAAGVGFWMYYLDNGFDMTQAAINFLNSEEFRNLYDNDPTTPGYQEPTAETFVTKLYRHVLQRAPEDAGYQFWVDAMNNKNGAYGKAWSRAEVLLQFSESSENKAMFVGFIQNGFEYAPFTPG